MPQDDVTPDVDEQLAEAEEAHAQAARDRATPWGGEGGQAEGTGHKPPDTGAGEAGGSEIPAGVESIEPAADETDR